MEKQTSDINSERLEDFADDLRGLTRRRDIKEDTGSIQANLTVIITDEDAQNSDNGKSIDRWRDSL